MSQRRSRPPPVPKTMPCWIPTCPACVMTNGLRTFAMAVILAVRAAGGVEDARETVPNAVVSGHHERKIKKCLNFFKQSIDFLDLVSHYSSVAAKNLNPRPGEDDALVLFHGRALPGGVHPGTPRLRRPLPQRDGFPHRAYDRRGGRGPAPRVWRHRTMGQWPERICWPTAPCHHSIKRSPWPVLSARARAAIPRWRSVASNAPTAVCPSKGASMLAP